jgi:hypothetical protein
MFSRRSENLKTASRTAAVFQPPLGEEAGTLFLNSYRVAPLTTKSVSREPHTEQRSGRGRHDPTDPAILPIASTCAARGRTCYWVADAVRFVLLSVSTPLNPVPVRKMSNGKPPPPVKLSLVEPVQFDDAG